MSKKQTAVEFFMEELLKLELGKKLSTIDYINKRYAIKKQALQLEREQIEEAYIDGMEFIPVDPNKYKLDAEHYYTQTYGECTNKS